MTTTRYVIEATQTMGTNEKIPYTVTVTPWGTGPSTASFEIWERVLGAWVNRTSTMMVTTGAVTVAGDEITCDLIQNVEEGHRYLGMFRFNFGGNEQSCEFDLVGEK